MTHIKLTKVQTALILVLTALVFIFAGLRFSDVNYLEYTLYIMGIICFAISVSIFDKLDIQRIGEKRR